MWIYLKNSFLSIVENNQNASMLHVRARREGDIEAIFPGTKITHTPGADYKYRADVPRKHVAEAVAQHVEEIAYTNFKNSVPDRQRHDTYMDIWVASHGLEREPGKPVRW